MKILRSQNLIDSKVHQVIGFWQQSLLHLQYLQHLIPDRQEFLRAHLPHVQGSDRPSGLEVTISGNNKLSLLSKP